jgi:hypothetical protein
LVRGEKINLALAKNQKGKGGLLIEEEAKENQSENFPSKAESGELRGIYY